MSNLLAHAARELELAGVEDDVRPSILGAISAFNAYGHSGGSAAICIHILNKLLQFENLSPLTNNSFEWNEVGTEMGGDEIWQSQRNSEAFSNDGGKTYYLLSERKRRRWYHKLTHTKPRVKMHTSEDAAL